MMRLDMASPKPVPPFLRVMAEGIVSKRLGSNLPRCALDALGKGQKPYSARCQARGGENRRVRTHYNLPLRYRRSPAHAIKRIATPIAR
jgi:hypothetical protein